MGVKLFCEGRSLTTILPLLKQYFTVYEAPPFPADTITMAIDGQVIAVAKGDLSPRELALLSALVPQLKSTHPWALYLQGQGPAPSKKEVRFLQFAVSFEKAAASEADWLEAFISLFTSKATGFFLTSGRGVIVEPQSKTPASLDELQGMMDTLDTDFGTKTRLFVGHFWQPSDEMPNLFAEESRLAESTSGRLENLQSIALNFYTQNPRSRSTIMKTLTTQISQDDLDMKPVINALYQNQGNLTAAAKALYLHRNTLQYRIDKFQSQTGFSLKQMDDLVLCYLLVQGK